MEANERYHFIDIADDSFHALTIACAPGTAGSNRLRNGHSGEDAAGY
jgi:hypothetical protein